MALHMRAEIEVNSRARAPEGFVRNGFGGIELITLSVVHEREELRADSPVNPAPVNGGPQFGLFEET